MRIVILGRAGAGKTTLARRIGHRTGSPVIVLDAIWSKGWGPADVWRFRALVAESHRGDDWISDGNFAAATFDLRLPRADLVVWLEPPLGLCLWRATARVFRTGEAHRPEDIVEVFRFAWSTGRARRW
ncbi:MAG: hypothetical protein ABI376_01180 [Caulobacteraceae bacterium]